MELVGELTSILDTTAPDVALGKMAEIIRNRTESDGAKVLIVKHTVRGVGLEQLCRTDNHEARRGVTLLSREKGLADWVVHNSDWLLVPDMAVDDGSGGVADRPLPLVLAETGEHDLVEIRPKPEKAYEIDVDDDEKTMLFAPIYNRPRRTGVLPAGVLAVWRKSLPPYTDDDAHNLCQLSTHFGSAARRLLQLETLQRELTILSSFAKGLHDAKSLANTYRAVGKGICELTFASHVVVFYHDTDRPDLLYYRSLWSADGASKDAMKKVVRGFCTRVNWRDDGWDAIVREEINERLKQFDIVQSRCRKLLTVVREDGEPSLSAALIDPGISDEPFEFFANDLVEHSAQSFLHYAASLLPVHIQTFARRVADNIGGALESPAPDPNHVLMRSADLLADAISASGVLVYSGPPDRMRVVYSAPKTPDLDGFPANEPSLTADSIAKRESRRMIEVGDDQEPYHKLIDDRALRHIRNAFGWNRIHSWLGRPVVRNARCHAFFSVFTADDESFLGNDHEQVAHCVAKSAAWELHKAMHSEMLGELNEMANELAVCRRDEMPLRIAESLKKWMDRFVKPYSEVAVIARSERENLVDRVLLTAATSDINEEQLDILFDFSRELGDKKSTWNRGDFPYPQGASRRSKLHRWAGIALPVKLPGKSPLGGHLCVLNREPFFEDEIHAVREAARELAVILKNVQLDSEWRQAIGRFRHAVLGPVQGLTSAAQCLAELTERTAAHVPEADKAKTKVVEESESIRLWRENQRLYVSDKIEIRPRIHALRPLFERCVERYRPCFAQRGIELTVDWKRPGELRFSFDEQAVDLVLSNLLDNARKYAFFNREVVVGATSKQTDISIWVEDIGHPVPEKIAEKIYEEEWHIDWQDPFRTIEGEGLGLPMAKAVVRAHGGRLYHSSVPDANVTEGETAPYRVRFTFELPTHWRRSK